MPEPLPINPFNPHPPLLFRREKSSKFSPQQKPQGKDIRKSGTTAHFSHDSQSSSTWFNVSLQCHSTNDERGYVVCCRFWLHLYCTLWFSTASRIKCLGEPFGFGEQVNRRRKNILSVCCGLFLEELSVRSKGLQCACSPPHTTRSFTFR